MNSGIQIISLLVSFFYGIIFNVLTIYNFKVIKKYNSIIKNIITIMFILDIVIIYMIIIYKINKGYFHIYFILMVILGYITNYIIYSKFDVKHLFKRLK